MQAQMQQINPHFYNLISQFVKGTSNKDDLNEEKKRKREREKSNFVRRVRQTRPKVVEAKGAIQCKGTNRKRGAQCRNAALMEYIGPRPIYCAEHIELDPESLYEKCKSPYQKEIGDNKGCKEVVLKEFGVCYKHYIDVVNVVIQEGDFARAHHDLSRITELLSQLEKEAAAAKKKDGDLYQRKNKLIPKFHEMKKTAIRAVEELSRLVNDETMEENLLMNQKPEIAIPIPKEPIVTPLVLSATLPPMDLDIRSIEFNGVLSFESPY